MASPGSAFFRGMPQSAPGPFSAFVLSSASKPTTRLMSRVVSCRSARPQFSEQEFLFNLACPYAGRSHAWMTSGGPASHSPKRALKARK